MENLTVIIPFRDGHATIGRLLESIPDDVSILIVDDVSAVGINPSEVYKPGRNIGYLRLQKRGYFSGAVNAGIEDCSTDVLILNQDAWLDGKNVFEQVHEWKQKGYAIAGDGVMRHPAWPRGYVQGTCMFMSRAAIEKIGLLNEIDYPLWGATCEWQLRASRAGFSVLAGEVRGFHHAENRGKQFGTSIAAALHSEPDKREWFIRTPPAISIIVPCYNYGRYLKDAISSLIGGQSVMGECNPQTFQSFEVVIVDDASTDDSLKIAQSFSDDYKAIRVIARKKNGGTAATINTGIASAFGKYVTVLSADDMMEQSRLERLYRTAEQNTHRVIYDDLQLFKDGARFERLELPDYDFEKVLYKNSMHCGIFYEKRAWKECNGYPELMRDGREDWAFNVALGARGWCGVHIKEPLYLYRREGQNRSLRNASGQWYETYRARLMALYPELYAGERPSMCCGCGSKNTSTKSSSKSKSISIPIGSVGMTLLEYMGQRGPSTYFAENPHQTYVYGGKYHFIYVDNRHAAQMLDEMEGRNKMFRRGVLPTPHLETQDALVTQEAGETA